MKEGEFAVRTESVYICKSVKVRCLRFNIWKLRSRFCIRSMTYGGKIWLRRERITQVDAFFYAASSCHSYFGTGPDPDVPLILVSHDESRDPERP